MSLCPTVSAPIASARAFQVVLIPLRSHMANVAINFSAGFEFIPSIASSSPMGTPKLSPMNFHLDLAGKTSLKTLSRSCSLRLGEAASAIKAIQIEPSGCLLHLALVSATHQLFCGKCQLFRWHHPLVPATL